MGSGLVTRRMGQWENDIYGMSSDQFEDWASSTKQNERRDNSRQDQGWVDFEDSTHQAEDAPVDRETFSDTNSRISRVSAGVSMT